MGLLKFVEVRVVTFIQLIHLDFEDSGGLCIQSVNIMIGSRILTILA